MAFNELLGIQVESVKPGRVEMSMPITKDHTQPFGFLHGGATLTLLEAAASRGAECTVDPSKERPFGIEINVRHRKSGQVGDTLRGIAELDREELGSYGSRKQIWNVTAYDGTGDVVSEGTFTTKVVSLARLAEKGVKVPSSKA